MVGGAATPRSVVVGRTGPLRSSRGTVHGASSLLAGCNGDAICAMDHMAFVSLLRREWHARCRRRFKSSASKVGLNRKKARHVSWRPANSRQGIFSVTEYAPLVVL